MLTGTTQVCGQKNAEHYQMIKEVSENHVTF